MKKNIITLLILTALGSLSLRAEIPAELPMLKNAAVLKAYALNRAAGATMTVSSSGQVPNKSVTVYANKEPGDTADDLIAKLAITPVAITLASVKDQINLNVEVYDETHTPLFSGSRWFTLEVGDNGQLRLPSNWGNGDFITMQKVRVPFPGVQNVEVDFRDRNGKLLNNPSARVVEDGFLFPVDWTERVGEIKITYLDAQRQEQTAVYDLQSTSLKPPSTLVNWNQNFAVMGIEHYWRVNDNSTNITLKHLARELDVPVLALSQLSRAVEQRGGRPRLSDLRDSGSIEQDADVVMFIHREDKYKEDSDRPNIAEILIEKHRNGPTGKVELYFDEKKATFMSLEKSDFTDFERTAKAASTEPF